MRTVFVPSKELPAGTAARSRSSRSRSSLRASISSGSMASSRTVYPTSSISCSASPRLAMVHAPVPRPPTPIVTVWPARSDRTTGTSCSRAPGRGMPWWGRTRPWSRPRMPSSSEGDGVRWCRCLRCDAWFPVPLPADPAVERVPTRDEIELPLRGPALRDRYVLRLIALDRTLHVVILTFLAIVFLTFASHDKALHTDYQNIMNALNGGGAAALRVRGVLGYLRKAFEYTPTHLIVLALICLAYACLEGVEAVGLWLGRRWAEYLTFIATSLLIPYEIYELYLRVSIFKLLAFVINVLVVAYLLYAKRLFGVRGGKAAEAAQASSPGVPVG